MEHQYLPEVSRPGEWITLRGNNARTGKASAIGKMVGKPMEAASIDLGCYETLIRLTSGKETAQGATIHLGGQPDSDEAAARLDQCWNRSGHWFDLYGTGELVSCPPSHASRPVRLFEDRPGMQLLEATDVDFNVRAASDVNGLNVWDFSSGEKKLLFHLDFPYFIERPQVLAADMTGNGIKDIIVSGWDGTVVYSRDGQYLYGIAQKTAPDWHKNRKRGYVGAFDINHDGLNEIMIVGALQYHVDMLRNNGRELSVGWFHVFETDTGLSRRLTSVPYTVVGDFDGDGDMEIMINLWNNTDDHQWHISCYNAATGELKYDYPGAFCYYSEDIDGDGAPEIFCTRAGDLAVPDQGNLEIIAFREGKTQVVFSGHGSWNKVRWRTTPDNEVTHFENADGCMGEIRPITATIRGRRNFFIAEDGIIRGYEFIDRQARPSGFAVQFPAGTTGIIERTKHQTGRAGQVCQASQASQAGKNGRAGNEDDELLLVVKSGPEPEGHVLVQGAVAEKLACCRRKSGVLPLPVVADIDHDGRNEIIIANQRAEIECFSLDDQGRPVLHWRRPGFGMAWQYNPSVDYGVSVDDLNGDGYREILVRSSGPTGAALSVLDKDGRLLWQREFADIHGGELSFFRGNVAFFGTADLGRGNRDIVLAVQRGIALNGRTYLLDGKTGEILHEKALASEQFSPDGTAAHSWKVETGAGGFAFTTSNLGNGHDTVATGYGNLVWALDGATREILFEKFMTGLFYKLRTPENSMFWVMSIVPLAVRKNDGSYAYFCANCHSVSGLLNLDGKLAWGSEKVDFLARDWQCLFDPDGTGEQMVAEICQDAEDHTYYCHVYSPLDGIVRDDYSLQVDRPVNPSFITYFMPVHPIACDIDGDGRDEIIFSLGDRLQCVDYQNGRVAVLWESEPGTGEQVSPPVAAALFSDDQACLLYTTRDGWLKILR